MQFLQGAPTVTIWEHVFSLITQSRATHNTGEYVGNLNPSAHWHIADLWGTFQKMWLSCVYMGVYTLSQGLTWLDGLAPKLGQKACQVH